MAHTPHNHLVVTFRCQLVEGELGPAMLFEMGDPAAPASIGVVTVESMPDPECGTCARELATDEHVFGYRGRLYCGLCGLPEEG